MARVGARSLVLAAILAVAPPIASALSSWPLALAKPRPAPLPPRIDVAADRDDDDLDGVPDGEAAFVPLGARVDTAPLGDAFVGSTLTATAGGGHARLLVRGQPLAWGTPVPAGATVQGLTPGVTVLEAARGGSTERVRIVVTGFGFRDGAGHDVDLTTGQASLDRAPPSELTFDAASLYDATDPLRIVVVTADDPPPSVTVESVGAGGAHLDALGEQSLGPVPCPGATEALHCFASAPLRFVIDDVDRRHALATFRSVRAELGGAVVLRTGHAGEKAQALRVLGPRDSAVGPIRRLRATVRPFVVRLAPGGVPSLGGNELGAVTAMRAELAAAAAPWGECGVTLGPTSDIAVRVVDPPPPHLLAVGNDLGLPASGGDIRFVVEGKSVVEVRTRRGQLPFDVAVEIARAVEHAGWKAVLSENARVGGGAAPSADVSVRRPSGALARLESSARGVPVSDDPTLTVRIGEVDLSDGLAHFGDADSVAGTLEERTLLKALDDGDPSTLEVVVVPFFTGGGRIGESFIGTDRSSLRNVVVLDRAGVRARLSSLTLAHELGHVLLDVPGHPDDYGIDTPTRLMDADASDASPFGPRRLTLDECARVVRESGPGARSPLLRDWPLSPLRYAATAANRPSR